MRNVSLDSLSKPLDKVCGLTSGGLLGDGLHEAEYVLGAVVNVAHKQVDLLFVELCHVLGDNNEKTPSI